MRAVGGSTCLAFLQAADAVDLGTLLGDKEGAVSNVEDAAPALAALSTSPAWASACMKGRDWQMETCGGWSKDSLPDGKIPDQYLADIERALWTNGTGSVIPKEKELLEQTEVKGVFCYGVVTPADETFDLAKRIAKQCDGYMFFSNYEDPKQDIKKVIEGSMKSIQGGEWMSALNTPVFLPVWRYIATNLAGKFKWFVKHDIDTVYQPQKLKDTLAGFDETNAASFFGPMGPMGIHSQGAMLLYKDQYPVCERTIALQLPQEDMYTNILDTREMSARKDGSCNWVTEGYAWESSKSTMEGLDACQGGDLNEQLRADIHKVDPALKEHCFATTEPMCPRTMRQEKTGVHEEEPKGGRCCVPMADIRCMLYVHPVKDVATYTAMAKWLGIAGFDV